MAEREHVALEDLRRLQYGDFDRHLCLFIRNVFNLHDDPQLRSLLVLIEY